MNIPIRRYCSLLVAYLRPQQRQVIGLALLLISSIALQLANPQILRTFIDGAAAGSAEMQRLWAGDFGQISDERFAH